MRVNVRARRSIGWLWLALVAVLPLPRPVYADSAPPWTDTQLVGFSDVILRGRVVDVAVARDEQVGSPYTYVTLDVADVLKGVLPDRRVTLKQLGGRVGSTSLEIAGQATFTIGEDVLVFLEVRPRDRTLTTTALWQGKFTIVSGAGGDLAVRYAPGAAERGVFSGQTRSLALWLGPLRSQIGDAPEAAGVIDTDPPERAHAMARVTGGATTFSAVWRTAAIRVDTAAPGQPGLADGGERLLRQAADFWTATGLATLEPGGLQPAGCFSAREPDGRITVGPDTCLELSPRGGTLALSGTWVAHDGDTTGTGSQAVGGGVITNRGEAMVRLLARPICFERLVTHELGHTLGLADAPDGDGVMAPALECGSEFGAPAGASITAAARPTRAVFVPLGVPATTIAPNALDTIACLVGCRISAAAAISAPNPPTNLAATLSGATMTLTWTAPTTDTAHDVATGYTVEQGSATGLSNIANAATGSTATTYSTTVTGNSTIYVRVRGTNANGAGDPSNEIIVAVGRTVPNAPTNLTYSLSGSTLTLTWTAPQAGNTPTGYTVEAGSAAGLKDVIDVATGSLATSYSTTVGGSTALYVRVRATNAAGASDPSNEVIVVVGNAGPGAPTNLTYSLTGPTLTLTWTAPQSGSPPTGYTVEQGSATGLTDIANVATGSIATTYSTTVAGNSTLYVRVRATNANGTSNPSNEVVVVVLSTAPSAPTALGYSVSGSTLTLVWTAPLGGSPPTAYTIEAGSASGGTNVANFSTGSTATTFSATVGGNATFYIRVRATNASGTSAASGEIVVVIGSPVLAPGIPSGLAASAAGSSVTLTWTAPTTGGSVTNYVIEAGSSSGAANLANFSTGSSATVFSAAGVSAGTYYVRVRASNAGGTSSVSNEVILIVGPGCTAPGAPGNLVASASGSTVTLTWAPGAGATSYGLQAGSGPGLSNLFDQDLVSAATTFTANNVGVGTYFVRVRSINACNVSAASNEAVILIR